MDALFAILHPDVHFHPSVDGSPVLEGRDAVVEWWATFATQDSELEVRPLEFEPRGNCVLVRGYIRRREGRALIENQVFWLQGFRDGMIDRMESYPSRASALAAAS